MITALTKVSFARMLGGAVRSAPKAMAPARTGMQLGGGAQAAQAAAARSSAGRAATMHPTAAPLQAPKLPAAPAPGGPSAIGNMGRRGPTMPGRIAGLLTPRNMIGAGAAGAGAAGLYGLNKFRQGLQQPGGSPFQQRDAELEQIYSRGGKL